MKKTTTLLTFLSLALGCFAQQGEILYTKFDPDWCLESIQYAPADSIKLDFDGDGVWDFAISMYYRRYIEIRFIPSEGWEYRGRFTDDTELPPAFQNQGIPESDSLVQSAPLGWTDRPIFVNGESYMCGVRKVVNDSTVYYGWFDQIWINASIPGNQNGGTPYIKQYQCVHDMAFCTIPNYPLRWGQTSLTGIEENGSAAFATVHPNPTTGLVTIVGENLNQADVVNMLGQCVATAQGKGETLQIDISSLPAGIYFVRITDDEGRKCTHKVVKE